MIFRYYMSYVKVANQRNDFLQKQSRQIANDGSFGKVGYYETGIFSIWVYLSIF